MVRVLTKNYRFKLGCLVRKYGRDAFVEVVIEEEAKA